MKNLNPFIPAIALIQVPKRSGRDRFKTGFLSVLLAHALVFSFLLIHAANSNRGGMASGDYPAALMNTLTEPLVVHARGIASQSAPSDSSTATATAINPPAKASDPVSTPRTVPAESRDVFHVIKSGDTLFGIAKMYGTSVNSIRSANKLSSDHLVVGSKLRIAR